MRRVLTPLTLLLAAAVLSAPAEAAAPGAPGIKRSGPQAVSGGGKARIAGVARARGADRARLLWATVNICDTSRNPDTLGVRGSMPGNGLRQRMYMRFRAQYYSSSRDRWLPVAGNGVSPWVLVGSARYRFRQAGWTFKLSKPPAGSTFTLRGVVDYHWRAARRVRSARRRGRARRARVRWVVKRRHTRVTRSGLPQVGGGDPAWASKALCIVL